MENHVILVDEYDQIMDDLQPFHSLSSEELARRIRSVSRDALNPLQARTFTLHVVDGSTTATGPHQSSAKVQDMQDLMSDFVEMLPDMDLVFASHQLPTVAVSGEAKRRHLHYAEKGLRAHHFSLEVDSLELISATRQCSPRLKASRF